MPETQGSQTAPGILDRIVETKHAEVAELLPLEAALAARAEEAPPPRDLAGALCREGEVALMAEVKRRSPGAGSIRPHLDPGVLALDYQDAGAAAVSVLTDSDYFGGSLGDLVRVRETVRIPVFRKDFIVHRIQLLEARGAGADGVLLIARILSGNALNTLHAQAVELGLTPLVEVHDAGELARALDVGCRLVGVNNRNLQTFQTSLEVTQNLLPAIPLGVTVVSESGIRTPEDVDRLGGLGVHGVLVGESLLRAEEPGKAAAELVGRTRVGREAG